MIDTVWGIIPMICMEYEGHSMYLWRHMCVRGSWNVQVEEEISGHKTKISINTFW